MSEMLLAYKYHIYPKVGQERLMKSHLSMLCELYNTLRDLKIDTWKQKHISLSRTNLRLKALELRRRNERLKEIHSQVVQSVATRLARSFKIYFEGRARFPKHKHPKKYLSFTYPQTGFKLCNNKLYLSGIGNVRIFMHRPMEGQVKTLTVKYNAGQWYAVFTCKIPDREKTLIEQIPDGRIKGGDMGLIKFLTLSDGATMEPPKFLRKSEEKIKRLQHIISRAKKGSRNRRKLALRLAKQHHHVACQRDDHQNKTLATLYKTIDGLFLERLSVTNMVKNHCLAKSLQDASPGKFLRKAQFKADVLGKWFLPVDPWGTTQFCHKCLTWVPKELCEREHICPNCREELSRDENSAKLIKRIGLSGFKPDYAHGRWVNTPAEPKPLPTLRVLASRGVEAGSPRLKPWEDVT